MNWNVRYASQKILDRFTRGLTNFYGTKKNPTGNTVVHDEANNKFVAKGPNGEILGHRSYGLPGGIMFGRDITNSSGHYGVGLAIDHATAQYCTAKGLGFECNSAIEESASRPENESLNAETYHKAVGREGQLHRRIWPKNLMASVATLHGVPQ